MPKNSRKLRLWVLSIVTSMIVIFAGYCSLSYRLNAESTRNGKQILQAEIFKALSSRKERATFSYKISSLDVDLKKEIRQALDAAVTADDYTHYIIKAFSYKATLRGKRAIIDFKFSYWENLEQTIQVRLKITSILKTIVKPGMNTHQKEKTIHDWIVSHINYDKNLVSHSAYDGLVRGSTVCQGYALITYEMMRQANLPVKIVAGTSRSQAHVWNLVQLDGQWYHLDVTWDDTQQSNQPISYRYYNLTNEELKFDHKWNLDSYPKANTEYGDTLRQLSRQDVPTHKQFYTNFYLQLGYHFLEPQYTSRNVQQLIGQIQDAVHKKNTFVTLRYTKNASVKEDMKAVFNRITGLAKMRYSFEKFTRSTGDDIVLKINLYY